MALQSLEPTSGDDRVVRLAAWGDFSALHQWDHMMASPPLGRMAAPVTTMPPPMRCGRELPDSAPLFERQPIWAFDGGKAEAAVALPAEGWLVDEGW
jgi:hypothetical protein